MKDFIFYLFFLVIIKVILCQRNVSRIIANGNNPPDGGYPFITTALLVTSRCPNKPLECTGVIIHKNFVLTAGLCIENAKGAKVRYGGYARNALRLVIALQFYTDKNFLERGINIGLVRTEEMQIQPTDIASLDRWQTDDEPLKTHYPVTVCGWGSTETEKDPDHLTCTAFTRYTPFNSTPAQWIFYADQTLPTANAFRSACHGDRGAGFFYKNEMGRTVLIAVLKGGAMEKCGHIKYNFATHLTDEIKSWVQGKLPQ